MTPRPPRCSPALVAFFLMSAIAMSALAQTESTHRKVGIGIQVGEPWGITLKHYIRTRFTIDGLAAWDLNDSVHLGAFIANVVPIPDSPISFYLGPGIFAGIDRIRRRRTLRSGLGIQTGLNFFTGSFEVFLQGSALFYVTPDPLGDVGASVGLRYFF